MPRFGIGRVGRVNLTIMSTVAPQIQARVPLGPFRHRRGQSFCAADCCAPAAASTSRSFDATRWPSSPAWAAALHLSGPPRTGEGADRTHAWTTPEGKNALARSLPIEFSSSKRAAESSPMASEPQSAATCSVCSTSSAGSLSSSATSSAGVQAPVQKPRHATPESPAAAQAEVVRAACWLLDRVVGECQLGSQLSPDQVFAPIFHSVSVPSISGGDYLVHHLLRLGLARKEHLSEAVVLHAFLLIDHLLQREAPKGFHLCTRNVHRVLLATTLVSAKLLDDECYNNNYWASVGGVSLPHLNELEIELMRLLNFELLVTASMIDAARTRMLATVASA